MQVFKITPKLVHKPSSRDVVVANLRRHATLKNSFEADFIPPHANHFLGWPDLGHVEGMAMIEAVQQAAKAARHVFFNDARKGYYFTGITDFRMKQLLPKNEKAVVRVTLERPRETTITPRGSQPMPATFQKVEAVILNSAGKPVAKGNGHAVIYDLKTDLW